MRIYRPTNEQQDYFIFLHSIDGQIDYRHYRHSDLWVTSNYTTNEKKKKLASVSPLLCSDCEIELKLKQSVNNITDQILNRSEFFVHCIWHPSMLNNE